MRADLGQPTERELAKIKRELRGYSGTPNARVPEEWVTLKQATAMIGAINNQASLGLRYFAGLPYRKHASGAPGRRPVIFRRKDIERIAMLRAASGIGIRAAIKVVAAELNGKINPLLGEYNA